MFVRTPKIICRRGKEKTSDATFLRCDGKQACAFDEHHHCVGSGFDREAMLCIAPPEKIPGQIERDDVTGAIFESLAMANDPPHYPKQVVGGVAFAGDDVVSVETDGPPLKSE